MNTSAKQHEENKRFIVGPRLERLQSPLEEARLAKWVKSLGTTANESRDAVTNLMWEWYETGGEVKAHVPNVRGVRPKSATKSMRLYTLDIKRMEWTGELTVYSIHGEPVHLDLGAKLIRLDEAFRSNTRRTLNRQFEKIDNPSRRRVTKSLWSLMFWEDVAYKIAHFED